MPVVLVKPPCPGPPGSRVGDAPLRSSLLHGVFLILLLVLLMPVPDSAADEEKEEQRTDKDLVDLYARALKELCSNPAECGPAVDTGKLENLIQPILRLRVAPITDPDILQSFPFVDSYEALFSLAGNPCNAAAERVSQWRTGLLELDAKAYKVNRFFDRPAARWVVQEARSLSAQPTRKMLGGYIEREQGTVSVSPEGHPCRESKRNCEKVRYVLLKCLVPGVHDPREARDRLHAFPPDKANRRVTHYWEVLLEEETLLIRRNYRLKPLPGYEGTMENYHQLVFRDTQRIVILEENTRAGKFILQTDNAAVYIQSPPYGVTVALLFTGKYAMEGFFRMMVGNKTVTEPLGVLAILRQYMIAPELGVEHAVRAGEKDFAEVQSR